MLQADIPLPEPAKLAWEPFWYQRGPHLLTLCLPGCLGLHKLWDVGCNPAWCVVLIQGPAKRSIGLIKWHAAATSAECEFLWTTGGHNCLQYREDTVCGSILLCLNNSGSISLNASCTCAPIASCCSLNASKPFFENWLSPFRLPLSSTGDSFPSLVSESWGFSGSELSLTRRCLFRRAFVASSTSKSSSLSPVESSYQNERMTQTLSVYEQMPNLMTLKRVLHWLCKPSSCKLPLSGRAHRASFSALCAHAIILL